MTTPTPGSLVSVSTPMGRSLWKLARQHHLPVTDSTAHDAWIRSVGSHGIKAPTEGVLLSTHNIPATTMGGEEQNAIAVILSPGHGPLIVKFKSPTELSQHLTPIPSDR